MFTRSLFNKKYIHARFVQNLCINFEIYHHDIEQSTIVLCSSGVITPVKYLDLLVVCLSLLVALLSLLPSHPQCLIQILERERRATPSWWDKNLLWWLEKMMDFLSLQEASDNHQVLFLVLLDYDVQECTSSSRWPSPSLTLLLASSWLHCQNG